ncbi:DUF916 and DUF3324 domain-containing protein [Oceanobacillus halophilus]|uniref:DUF916 and DUF3324 domain-containing protein n=1 Tax=Oceanobacillus halophilus TaxID=930130 RepID=A0A494ZYC0_9BACI|nr:DUF916 and DUF3324 domain-containing protein [Oceanobacillus halophilus]RKQ31520.1 DUF916 and DUF3324 domain-containing protein [Oceanobacillus halophilus]
MKLLKLFLVILLVFLFSIEEATAATGERVGYSIRAIIPENQIDKKQTYFDLWMEPEQEQEIFVDIFNSSNEDAEFSVQVTNATTNRNGLIDYSNVDAIADDSLAYPMTDIAAVRDEVIHVPAGKSRTFPITLVMPKEEFDGIILGGIHVEKVMEEEADDTQGVQLKNKYAYVLGLQLRETDTEMEPNLHLKDVRPDLVNYRTAIIATIQNSEPVIVNNLNVTATVHDSSGEELKTVQAENYRMAPNSTMDFPIDWDNKGFDPGLYSLTIQASAEHQEWEWEESFEIKSEEVEELNDQAVKDVQTEKNGENIYTSYIIGGLTGIILVLIGVIIYMRMKWKKA